MPKSWKDIHSDFENNRKLKEQWKEQGFTYEQTKKWIKVGKLTSTDADFAKWLRGANHTPEQVSVNEEELEKLKEEYQEMISSSSQDSSSSQKFSITDEEKISQEQVQAIEKKIKEKSIMGTSVIKIIPFSTSLKKYAIVISRGLYYANWLVSYESILESDENEEVLVEVLKRFPNLSPASGYSTKVNASEAAEKIKEEIKNQDEFIYLRNAKPQLEEENRKLKNKLEVFEKQVDNANKEIDQLKKEISQLKRIIDNTRNILIIGHTGNGKSTLANVLIGTNKFKEGKYAVSETRDIQDGEFKYEGIKYRVIDTVGIGDTKLTEREVLDKLSEAAYAVKDGLHQVLFVTSGRFDKSEVLTYNLLRKVVFDEDVTKYTTIVRTKFHDFENEEECNSDVEVMKKENKELTEVIQSCNKVIHVENYPRDLEKRNKSRIILLRHLVSCQDVYEPKNLRELNNRINNSVIKKVQLEKDLTNLKRCSEELSNQDNSLVERIKNLESEIEKQKEAIRQETREHIEEKGVNWREWAETCIRGVWTTTSLVATIVQVAACKIM